MTSLRIVHNSADASTLCFKILILFNLNILFVECYCFLPITTNTVTTFINLGFVLITSSCFDYMLWQLEPMVRVITRFCISQD